MVYTIYLPNASQVSPYLRYPTLFEMASSLNTYGDQLAGKSGKQCEAIALCDFTIIRTSTALEPIGDMDVEIVTPEKHIVKALVWLSFMYSELQKEIKCLGNVILDI